MGVRRTGSGTGKTDRDVSSDVEDRSLLDAIVGDGRSLLFATAGALVFAGGFAIYLAATRQMLPHDLDYLGMSSGELDHVADGRLMDFMIHDRVSWGATLISVGVMYAWLVSFPLARGERWAWWAITISGAIGFLSFMSYLGTGYLDTWHGLGSVLLLPVFVAGVTKCRPVPTRWSPEWIPDWWGAPKDVLGRSLVVASGTGLVLAGATILTIGVTSTFVPSDLEFVGTDRRSLDIVSPHLVPLVAHDRVGFAGGVIVGGLLVAAIAWWGHGRAARQAIATAGAVAYGSTIAVHVAVGYTDIMHLLPVIVGSTTLITGLVAWQRAERRETGGETPLPTAA